MDQLNNLLEQCLQQSNKQESKNTNNNNPEIVNISDEEDEIISSNNVKDNIDPISLLLNPAINPSLKPKVKKSVNKVVREMQKESLEEARKRALLAINRREQEQTQNNKVMIRAPILPAPQFMPPKRVFMPIYNQRNVQSSERELRPILSNKFVNYSINGDKQRSSLPPDIDLTTDETLNSSTGEESNISYTSNSTPFVGECIATETMKASDAVKYNMKRSVRPPPSFGVKKPNMLPSVFQYLPNVTQIIATPKSFDVFDAPIYGRILQPNIKSAVYKRKEKFDIDDDKFLEMFPDQVAINRTPTPYKVGNLFKLPDKEDVIMVKDENEVMPVILELQKIKKRRPEQIRADYDEEEYEVEKVLLKNIYMDKEPMYLLKWAGYGYEEVTWEKESSMGCTELVRDYLTRRNISTLIYNTFTYAEREHYSGFLNKYVNGVSDSIVMDAYVLEDILDDYNKKHNYAKLIVENWTDDAELPLNWKPITKCLYTHEASKSLLQLKAFKKPCKCEQCSISTCDCMTVRIDHGYIHANVNVITECMDTCHCNSNKCPPSIFMKGRQVELILFKNYKSGWSLRALRNIKEGKFITEYIGIVRTAEECKTIEDVTYLFELDFNGKPKYVIDASEYGNEARFINHSCEPNLAVVMTFGALPDPNIYKIYFFAKRDILAGEELTFNYFGIRTPPKNVPDYVPRCQCGAPTCRQYLF